MPYLGILFAVFWCLLEIWAYLQIHGCCNWAILTQKKILLLK